MSNGKHIKELTEDCLSELDQSIDEIKGKRLDNAEKLIESALQRLKDIKSEQSQNR